MTVLAIETSCDETAVAILREGELLASEVATQITEHQKFGGVVPEVASRNHLVHLPRLLERALASAGVEYGAIDAFAATAGPGLASSLLVGNSTAKGLAIGARKPFLAINHLEGHLLSPFFRQQQQSPFSTSLTTPGKACRRPGDMLEIVIPPHVALIVSGGHTLLVNARGLGEYEILGRTLDDAAGEAFDKVAKLLGLGYPGGPAIEQRARPGDAKRFRLPRSMLDSGDLNLSFSGLKTAVRYLLPAMSVSGREGSPTAVIPSEAEGSRGSHLKASAAGSLGFARDDVNDLCASFQAAVIDVLREKSLRAVRQTGTGLLTLSGGVSCNVALRNGLAAVCQKYGIELLAAEPSLCTDNAAMIGFAALLRAKELMTAPLSAEIDPNLALA